MSAKACISDSKGVLGLVETGELLAGVDPSVAEEELEISSTATAEPGSEASAEDASRPSPPPLTSRLPTFSSCFCCRYSLASSVSSRSSKINYSNIAYINIFTHYSLLRYINTVHRAFFTRYISRLTSFWN